MVSLCSTTRPLISVPGTWYSEPMVPTFGNEADLPLSMLRTDTRPSSL